MENVIDRVRLKTLAKDQIQGKIGKLFLCSIIVGIIGGVSSILPIVGAIGNILVSGPLEFGLAFVFLGLTKGEEVVIGNLFKGFDNFGRNIGVYFLRSLFVVLWALLLIVPGIIKSLSYSMAMYIAVDDPNIGVMQALQESERIMDGHKMDLFVLGLSFIPWILLVAVTFGLAGIYVIPYMEATIANFYNEIKYE